MSKVGSKLIAAAKEARSIAQGNTKPCNLFVPADIDVKSIRRKTGLSQDDFAATFGFSVNQIRDWEQHRSRPLGGVRAYLILIQSRPEQMVEIVREVTRQNQGEVAA